SALPMEAVPETVHDSAGVRRQESAWRTIRRRMVAMPTDPWTGLASAPPLARSRAGNGIVIDAEEHVAETARALGFPLVGCTPLPELEREQFLSSWLAAGRAGEMRYLTTRTAERLDPRRSYPWARAIVCLAYPYRPPPPPEPEWRAALRGRIAA